MSLNPFTENSRDNSGKFYYVDLSSTRNFPFQGHRPPSNMYDNAPPALMSMSMSHYDNNSQHDDYGNSMNTNIEQPFDLSMVTDDIPYYDLPAGLMCLLVKVIGLFGSKLGALCEFSG